MQLQDLQTFELVAAERSFSRAAKKLHRTQPAVSQAIRRLDEELWHRAGSPDRPQGRGGLQSETRRRTAGHNVTERAKIDRIWAGIKHSIAFVATCGGVADTPSAK